MFGLSAQENDGSHNISRNALKDHYKSFVSSTLLYQLKIHLTKITKNTTPGGQLNVENKYKLWEIQQL
ncbi:hypothetical protein ACE6H2_021658 [Prunus campanulata]